MPEHRRYTRKAKVAAVQAVAASSVLAAAEATGVPESTLRYWLDKPEFAELRDKTREEASKGWEVIQHLALARLRDLIPTMEPRDLTVLAGIAVDKSQLLAGGATSRTETRDLTARLDEHQADQLMNDIDEWLANREEPVDADA